MLLFYNFYLIPITNAYFILIMFGFWESTYSYYQINWIIILI
jgi:hypothetical protein